MKARSDNVCHKLRNTCLTQHMCFGDLVHFALSGRFSLEGIPAYDVGRAYPSGVLGINFFQTIVEFLCGILSRLSTK